MISVTEFYEKYWMIRNSDGSMGHPPPLTTEQKTLLEALETEGAVIFGHLRGGRRFISVVEDYKKINQNEDKTNLNEKLRKLQ